MIDWNGHCWLPVFAHPDPNERNVAERLKLKELEEERNTWFLGTYFFRKYFTVFDNTPAYEGKEFNYVGIGACKDHAEHVEITDDEYGGKTANTVDPIPVDSDGRGVAATVVFVIIMILIVSVGLWYVYKQRTLHQE